MTAEIMIRTSERTCFKTCRQKWWWAYVEHLKAKRPRPALAFGTMVHEALALYYPPGKKRGVHPARNFEVIYNQWLADGNPDLWMRGDEHDPKGVSAGTLGVAMLEGYIDQWGLDHDIEVIAPEMTFQVDIFDEKGNYLFTYVGTMDAVVRVISSGLIGFFEHKTGAGLTPFGAPIELDEQSGSYWTFGPIFLRGTGVLGEDEDLDFIMFNRLAKSMPDLRPSNEAGLFLNKDGTVSKKQPPPKFKREYTFRTQTDRDILMRRVKAEAYEMKMIRMGKLEVYKNPDRHCGYCEFRDMCELHETGSDWTAIRDEMFTVWEPYADHAETKDEEEF